MGQEFFHVFLAPAGLAAGGDFDLGAVQGLQGQTNGPGAHGQLDGLFEDAAEGLLIVTPEAPEAVVTGLQQGGEQRRERCSRQATSSLRVARMR